MSSLKDKLALECVLMSLQSRVLPNKHESPVDFAKRLHAMGSLILDEIAAAAAPAGENDPQPAAPVYSEDDDQSQEFEPEETLTEEQPVKVYQDEDGQEDWHVADAPSAPFPSSKDSASPAWAVRLDKLAQAKCPNCCRRAYSDSAVDTEFGYRRMGDGTIRVQSWCRVCRKEQLRAQSGKPVVLYSKEAFGIPVGMSPAQFRKLWLRLSKGRTVLQVMLEDSMKDLLNDGWKEQQFSWTTKKKD